MARKRAKVKFSPATSMFFAVCVSVVVGLNFSPLTSLQVVRIQGEQPEDMARIERMLAEYKGIPFRLLDQQLVANRIASIPWLKDAGFAMNVFGRGVLSVTYREPVAMVNTGTKLALEKDGTVFPIQNPPKNLIQVGVPERLIRPSLGLSGNWPSRRIATLALALTSLKLQSQGRIELRERGVLIFNMPGRMIIFGSPDELEKKTAILRARLAEEPDFLSRIKELNLTSHINPVVVWKNRKIVAN